MEIRQLKEDLSGYTNQINNLLHQLSENYKSQNEGDFLIISKDKGLYVFGAFDKEKLVGVATVFVRRNLYGYMGQIHDVIVDKNYRGRGLGKKLTLGLIEKVQEISNKQNSNIAISLTSRPARKEANKMYEKLGFQLRAEAVDKKGTNLYKINIKPK